MQAVVVEGYTDVMACHLAGVETAIATCGTAFGDEHIKILRRLLMDQNEFRGEVVFTFDGDAAGQKAALRAFEDDQKFVTQTFVAVEPSGMDPCELRQHKGDAAVRDLVARRVPLFEFAHALRPIGRYDLDTAEGRTQATRAGMDVVRQIRDVSLRSNYARSLAGWIGLADPDELVRAARGGVSEIGRRVAAERLGVVRPGPERPGAAGGARRLKVVLQAPALAGAAFDDLDDAVFTAPAYAAVRAAVAAAGGVAAAGAGGATWVDEGRRRGRRRRRTPPGPRARGRAAAGVRPGPARATPPRCWPGSRSSPRPGAITEVKSRLQRLNPVEQVAEYNRLFGELVALEAHRQVAARAGDRHPLSLRGARSARMAEDPTLINGCVGAPRGSRLIVVGEVCSPT